MEDGTASLGHSQAKILAQIDEIALQIIIIINFLIDIRLLEPIEKIPPVDAKEVFNPNLNTLEMVA